MLVLGLGNTVTRLVKVVGIATDMVTIVLIRLSRLLGLADIVIGLPIPGPADTTELGRTVDAVAILLKAAQVLLRTSGATVVEILGRAVEVKVANVVPSPPLLMLGCVTTTGGTTQKRMPKTSRNMIQR